MRRLVSFLSCANTHDDGSRISWLQRLQIKRIPYRTCLIGLIVHPCWGWHGEYIQNHYTAAISDGHFCWCVHHKHFAATCLLLIKVRGVSPSIIALQRHAEALEGQSKVNVTPWLPTLE